MKDKLKSAAIVLASVTDGKVSLIAGVTADRDAWRNRAQTAEAAQAELVSGRAWRLTQAALRPVRARLRRG